MKNGVGVNNDHGLEREADLMGGKAVSGVMQARLESGSSIEDAPIDSNANSMSDNFSRHLERGAVHEQQSLLSGIARLSIFEQK